ncbi:MAG: STAS-like domain-containing protein [Elusimicrobia bacterium]|nr:STAS-like domain-containing protein [Elusimicrobiota bacterium]
MKIEMVKFGEILVSRPMGKDAYLSMIAYLLPKNLTEPIQLDFAGVKVLAPSWGDEFITLLVQKYGKKVEFLNTENPSVKATLETLQLD